MHLTIDTDTENTAGLRFAAAILLQVAAGKEAPAKLADAPAPPPPPPSPAPVAAPPTPPPPAPPPPPATAPATTVGESGRDRDGVPWDFRIHSERKSLNKDGTWRVRKNLDKAYVQALSYRLRDNLEAPQGVPTREAPPAPPAPPPPPPPPTTTETPPEMRGLFGHAAGAPPPPPPPPAAPPAAPGTPDVATLEKFRDLMSRVVQLQKDGKLNAQQRVDGCTRVGVTSLQDLASRPDLVAAYGLYLDSLGIR